MLKTVFGIIDADGELIKFNEEYPRLFSRHRAAYEFLLSFCRRGEESPSMDEFTIVEITLES